MYTAVVVAKSRTKFICDVTVDLLNDNGKRIDTITEKFDGHKKSEVLEHGGKLATRLAMRKNIFEYTVKYDEINI
jgi:hypothetical protein